MTAEPARAAPAAPAEPTQPDAGAGHSLQPAHYDEIGIASWYRGWHQGRPTASGARFDLGARPSGAILAMGSRKRSR